MSDKANIAFLGTGLMGAPMARCLLKADHQVAVWNRSAAKARALESDGAVVFASAAEAVANADFVITMLSDGAAVTEVLFGGGTNAMKPGATVIDMSSVAPSTARDHCKRLDRLGFAHLDAPVSGGTAGAERGDLAIMAGGEVPVFEEAVPVLLAMGRPTHVGPSGSGQLAKLCNQSIVASTIAAVAEALFLARKAGADPVAVRTALRGGFAESRILELHGQRMLDRDFKPGGPAALQLKDLDNALDAAAEAGVSLPLTQQVRDRFHRLVHEMDGAHLDHSALLLELEASQPAAG